MGKPMDGAYDIKRTLLALRRSYTRRSHGTVGVGYGAKLVGGQSSPDRPPAVHFYVSTKTDDHERSARRLPRYVLARGADGIADRHHRIQTDVIAVGVVEPVSRGGVEIASLNERGVVSLLFENKPPAADRYLLTCAHVLGRLEAPVPNPDWVRLNDGSEVDYARTVFASTPDGGMLEFDVGIAKLAEGAAFSDCEVEAVPILRLSGLMPADDVREQMPVMCLLGSTGERRGEVIGSVALPDVDYPAGTFVVDNTFLVNIGVQVGHSGSPVYAGDRLVGFVYARSSAGLAWCHCIAPALAFVAAQTGLPLNAF